ncbi:MAG: DoxX family protein [Planctomycetota bacterium]
MTLFQTTRLSGGASFGLFVLRVVAGVAFMFHGWGKIQNPMDWMGPDAGVPGVFQALAAISEFGGGLAWTLGLLTPLASLGLLCTMAMAVRLHAFVLGDPFVAQGPGGGSYELALVYLSVAVLLLFAGPGSLSLDRAFFGEKSTN